MRNHNDDTSADQDPAVFRLPYAFQLEIKIFFKKHMQLIKSYEAREIIKTAIRNRYKLLPYIYTLLYRSHLYGETVARPLFFE